MKMLPTNIEALSRMSKPIFLTLIISLVFIYCKKQKSKVQQPNVILIMTDDQGYGDLACHGNPYVKTPTLDKLYKESVRFTDFHVDPSCSPTRSALLTGNYSIRMGVWHTIGGMSLLKKGVVTIADVFSDNGYKTGIFGKWHLGQNHPFRPQDRGFQETLVHGSGSVGNPWDYWGNDYYDDTYKHNGKLVKYDGYCNTVWFNEASRFLEKNKNNPFFCYIPTNLPHAPLTVDEEYIEPHKNLVSERLANYYGLVNKIDEDIATLFQKINELGLEDNTIVIFMTDNGPCPWFGGVVMDFETGFVEEGFTKGMRGGKIWGYENAHRVPFFIRWQKGNISGGRDIAALAAHIDVFPTLVDLCNLEIDPELKLDGKSLVPLLTGEQNGWKDRTLFVHNQRVEFPVKDKEFQVLTEDWRLVNRENMELYDIENDPEQKTNLASKFPDVVKELYQRYNAWWEDVSADIDQYSEISIGTPFENPVAINAHDAYTRKGEKIWVINVARDGQYEVTLNRWPKESGKKISENRSGSQSIPIEQVNFKVGNLEHKIAVKDDMTSVKVVVSLKAGTTCFQSSFKIKGSDKLIGTNFIYVDYVGMADVQSLKNYEPSKPDKLLRTGYMQKIIPYD